MAERRHRWRGAERMLRAVLHPAVFKALMPRRRRREGWSKEKGNKSLLSDTELCERLPSQDLIEMVLDRLPLRDLIEFRTVCKSWNAYILSVRSPPALVTKTTLVYFPPNGDFWHQPLTVYNDKTNNWDKHCLSFLADGGVLGLHSLVAVDGGLLCFCNSSLTNLVVCNPVSKQWRCLEPPSSVFPQLPGMEIVGCPDNYVLVGLSVNEEEGNYKLVLAGLIPPMTACKTMMTSSKRRGKKLSFTDLEASSRKCFVYDSCSRVWNEAPHVPVPFLPIELFMGYDEETFSEKLRNGKFGVWSNVCPRRNVASNGKLYWSITEESVYPMRVVVSFDIEKSKWCGTEVDDDDVRDLVVLDGKVLLVKLWDGMELTFDHNHEDGLKAFYSGIDHEIRPSEWECSMFEVQEAGSTIRLTKQRLPKPLRDLKRREQVTSKYDNQYGCVGHGTSLFVMHQVIDGDFRGKSWEMQGWRILHYDSATDSCVWLPQFDTYIDERFPVSWWTLRPSLRVLV